MRATRILTPFLALFLPAVAFAGPIDTLYYICDFGDELWMINRVDGGTVQVGDLGVFDVETMAYWPGTETIYACDAGDFGTVTYDPVTMPGSNLFNLISEVDGGGTANGSDGPQALDDVDGLSFDPWTSILWASNRRFGDYDLLFQIDPATGQFVPDAFGAGIDYVVIDETGIFLDIDDIAISPSDGKMYTIATQTGAAQVLEINKYTGDVQAVVSADQPDVEGLAYHNDGSFWGTVGTQDQFWQIDPATGVMTNMVDIQDSQCRDPEAVSALVADINLIEGTVWNDLDQDAFFDGTETGVQNVVVQLFLDLDADSTFSPGDVLLQQDTTDINGDYSFEVAARGDYITRVKPSSLPSGFAFTTDNIEQTEFTGFGQTNSNNDFGIASGPDCDSDGIPDFAEGGVGVDFDGDGIDNQCDLDSDNDGILDSVEGQTDSDGDGQADYIDKDSDNDGIPDGLEANSGLTFTGFDITLGWFTGTDSDGDGLLDQLDSAPATLYGASASLLANPDTDSDGVSDYLDKDSDDDGILDVTEAGGTDADSNGEIDGFADLDNDGYFDGANFNFLPITNTDSADETANGLTLLPDYLDRDSDGDGIGDAREGFCTTCYPNVAFQNDLDGDGIRDIYDVDQGGVPSTSYDHDGDGTPDWRDLDTDGDGISDAIEGNDANFDQVADFGPTGNDTDNDGLDDAYDPTPAGWGSTSNVPVQNQDGDAEPDWRDLDNTVNPGILYYLCDGTNTLFSYNRYDQTSTLIGATGAFTIEAIAYWPGNDTLYAANQGNLGWLNTGTGAFTSFGALDGGGTMSGTQGNVGISDVTSLAFHPWTGKFYGVQRQAAQPDLLFQIDTTTHQFVPDAFGAGADYLEINLSAGFKDVEDIAVDPLTGQMYIIAADNFNISFIIPINANTAALGTPQQTDFSPLVGFAYHNDGQAYATQASTNDTLWQIAVDGTLTASDDISTSCTSADGLAALVAPINTITGTVWDDLDTDQTINGLEVGIAGVAVRLYYDANGNGVVDGSDQLIQVDTTDVNGDFSFQFAATGNLVMQVVSSTLPAGYAFTTDNLETAVFADNVNFGEVDPNNNFGATNGADCDGDGIPDFAEGGVGVDFDGDGIDNQCDLDSDNDGILDADEMQVDTDGDGQYDYLDLDSDNDGIPDAIEANAGIIDAAYVSANGNLSGADTDGDGLLDVVDNDPAVPYGGGSTSAFANPDSDGDGVGDWRDKDSDNDGILDVIEAGGTDANGDGVIDSFTDTNNDGYNDPLTVTPLLITNSDFAEETGFGLTLRPDYIDLDSDYDGIADAIEGQTTAGLQTPPNTNDTDGDGIIDFWDTSSGGTPITPVDTDGDGVPDYSDNDSDNDTVTDIIEGNDSNADGIADTAPSGTDTDGDGIDDTFDTTPGVYGGSTNTPTQDTDGDGDRDWRDIDDDDDTINTVDETADINPNNGTPDYLEPNACGAGFVQVNPTSGHADIVTEDIGVSFQNRTLNAPDGSACTMGAGDTLGLDLTDTVPPGFDIQLFMFQAGGSSSTVGVHESVDGITWTPPRNSPGVQYVITNTAPPIAYPYSVTTNARFLRFDRVASTVRIDAVSYSFSDCEPDKDLDGIPDVTDIDDDNDGITDAIEGSGDFDGDGIPNDCDLDSDNDGLPDALEANNGVMPANMTSDGRYLPAFVSANDSNNNGMVDAVDITNGGTALVDPNTDGDGTGNFDRIDLDSDNDCLPDAMEGNSGSLPANMDGNGQYPVAYATANDSDGDGLIDDVDTDDGGTALVNPDTDGDTAPDYIDTDSDGDGISDFLEAYDPDIVGTGLDSDGDGIDDASDPDAGGTLPNLPDLDCNGVPDYLDVFAESAGNGNFNVGGTWAGGVAPGAGASIRINAGDTVTLVTNTVVGSVELLANAFINTGVFTLTVQGGWTNVTPVVFSDGKINFTGSGCTQDICGDIQFNALEINNPSGVDISCGTVSFSDSLCLTQGTLDVCGATSFTFLSDATGTASIAPTGTGDINCDVIVQRYKSGCVEGFFPLSSCFDVTFSQWGDDLLFYGFNNAPSGGPTSNTWYYDESLAGGVDTGFVEPADYNNSVVRARGYYIYQGLSNMPVTIDITGPVDLTPFSFPDATQTNTGDNSADGYNFVGNPYPSSIYWDLTPGNGWTAVGCCDAYFIWDECNDQYESWAGGVGVNGATGVIPQGSAFWIKYHLPGASLTVDRGAMVTDPGDFKTPENPDKVLFLQFVDPDGGVDETAIRLVDGAMEMMDLGFDAAKLASSAPVREIATVVTDGAMSMNFSINGLPDNGMDRTVPVVIRAPETAVHQLRFKNLESFPQEMCIVIEDLVTGDFIDPRVDSTYSFAFTSTDEFTNRFDVHFSYPMEVEKHNETCIGAADGYAVINHPGTGPFEYTWVDADGHIVQQTTTALSTDTLFGMAPGIYYVTVANSGATYCSNMTSEVIIGEPAYPLSAGVLATASGCDDEDNGSINLVVAGGAEPFSYAWSNGATSQDINQLAAGSYTVVVTDANGCSTSATAEVEDGSIIEADFVFAADTVNLYYGEALEVTNSSVGASAYVWDFGDGSGNSIDPNPVHYYDTVGVYSVNLKALEGACMDEETRAVVVINQYVEGHTAVETNVVVATEPVTAFANRYGIVLELGFELPTDVNVSVLNTLGQTVYTEQLNGAGQSVHQLSMRDAATGVYLVRVQSETQQWVTKVALD